jgi:hypothetical protein
MYQMHGRSIYLTGWLIYCFSFWERGHELWQIMSTSTIYRFLFILNMKLRLYVMLRMLSLNFQSLLKFLGSRLRPPTGNPRPNRRPGSSCATATASTSTAATKSWLSTSATGTSLSSAMITWDTGGRQDSESRSVFYDLGMIAWW